MYTSLDPSGFLIMPLGIKDALVTVVPPTSRDSATLVIMLEISIRLPMNMIGRSDFRMENHGKGQKIHPAADFISVPIQGNFDFGIVRHCSALFGIVRHWAR